MTGGKQSQLQSLDWSLTKIEHSKADKGRLKIQNKEEELAKTKIPKENSKTKAEKRKNN